MRTPFSLSARLGMSVLFLAVNATACGDLAPEDGAAPAAEPGPDPIETGEQALNPACLISPSLCFGSEVVNTGDVGQALRRVATDYSRIANAFLHLPLNGGLAGTILGLANDDNTHVTLKQRQMLCKATGGIGLYGIHVKPCVNGKARVEFNNNALPAQDQACSEGVGGPYDPNFCAYKDPNGLYYFDDGPSIPEHLVGLLPPRVNRHVSYTMLFWPAGQKHDYCYHNGTPTYGFTKKQCDDQFLTDLISICELNYSGLFTWFDQGSCRATARLMHQAVSRFGDDSWDDSKTWVNYLRRRTRGGGGGAGNGAGGPIRMK